MLATEGQLGEFLIGTSNQSEILRENVGIQFLSLRQIHGPTAPGNIQLGMSTFKPSERANQMQAGDKLRAVFS
jgi:hypothetical protein